LEYDQHLKNYSFFLNPILSALNIPVSPLFFTLTLQRCIHNICFYSNTAFQKIFPTIVEAQQSYSHRRTQAELFIDGFEIMILLNDIIMIF
jgi:hypothetical protein